MLCLWAAMWSKGNLERGFEIELFNKCYWPSGFRACGPKRLDAASILPNHPCYQLHHTRILNFLVLLSVGIHVVKGEFGAGICTERFQNILLLQRLPACRSKLLDDPSILPNVARYQLRYTRGFF